MFARKKPKPNVTTAALSTGMSKETAESNEKTSLWIFLLHPLVILVGAGILWAKAWYHSGHMPYYGHPDPSDIGMTWLLVVTVYLCFLIPLSVIGIIYFRKDLRLSHYLLYGISLLIIVLLIEFDWLGIYDWISD